MNDDAPVTRGTRLEVTFGEHDLDGIPRLFAVASQSLDALAASHAPDDARTSVDALTSILDVLDALDVPHGRRTTLVATIDALTHVLDEPVRHAA